MVQNHEFADTTEDHELTIFTITSASRTKISGSENIQEGRWLARDTLLTAHN